MEDKMKGETVCTTKSFLAFNLQTAAAPLLLAVCWWCLLSVRVTRPQTQSRRAKQLEGKRMRSRSR